MKFAYAAMLLVLSIYIVTRESITLRNIKLDGLEIYIFGAACFSGFVDMMLSAIFDYDSEDSAHPYRWYHYTLMSITVTLIVIALGFTFLEEEILKLPDR